MIRGLEYFFLAVAYSITGLMLANYFYQYLVQPKPKYLFYCTLNVLWMVEFATCFWIRCTYEKDLSYIPYIMAATLTTSLNCYMVMLIIIKEKNHRIIFVSIIFVAYLLTFLGPATTYGFLAMKDQNITDPQLMSNYWIYWCVKIQGIWAILILFTDPICCLAVSCHIIQIVYSSQNKGKPVTVMQIAQVFLQDRILLATCFVLLVNPLVYVFVGRFIMESFCAMQYSINLACSILAIEHFPSLLLRMKSLALEIGAHGTLSDLDTGKSRLDRTNLSISPIQWSRDDSVSGSKESFLFP